MENKFIRVNYTTRPAGAPKGHFKITETGRISFNSDFVTEHDITRGSHAALYWDSASKQLALSLNESDDENSFPIVFIGKSDTSAYVSAGRFFQAIDVKPTEHVGTYKYTELAAKDISIDADTAELFAVTLK